MRFFQPEFHYLISDGGKQGYTAGEFPGLYYLNALLWIIFGKHIFITRSVSVIITFLGLFALYKTYWNVSQNYFWSVIWPLLIFCTPVIAEYGMSFLTDVPGFCFALMGWYFFEKYRGSSKDVDLISTAILFMIAGLLKVSSLILFVVILVLWFFELIGFRFGRNGKPIFNRLILQGFILSFSLMGVFSWYAFVHQFNSLHDGAYMATKAYPIWSLSTDQVINQAVGFWEWSAMLALPTFLWFALPVILILGIALLRYTPVFYRMVYSLTAVGVLMYLALWYQAIDKHDYYFVNAFALIAVLPLPFLTSDVKAPRWAINLFWFLGIVALIYGLTYTRHNLELRHNPSDRFAYPLTPHNTVELMRYYHWERNDRIGALSDSGIQLFLDSLGVDKEKKVVIFPDDTPNLTLLMIDRKGWSSAGHMYGTPLRTILDSKIALDADFLIVLQPDVYEEPGMCEFEQHRIGKFKNVEVVDLNKFADNRLQAIDI